MDPLQRLLALQQATQHLGQPAPKNIDDQLNAAVAGGLNSPAYVNNAYQPTDMTNRDALMMLLDLLPGSGDAIAIDEGINQLKQGNRMMAGLNFASTLPTAGDLLKLAGTGALGVSSLVSQMMRRTGKAPLTPFSSQAGVIGYHGSPHKFDEFSMEHIGSGEGEQAYGYGLYFAEKPSVARSYQMAQNRASTSVLSSGKDSMEVPDWLGFEIKQNGIDDAISIWEKRLAAEMDNLNSPGVTQPWILEGRINRLKSDLDHMRAIKANGDINISDPGAFYKVDIPDKYANNFLDWDKPLSEQKDSVKQAIKKMTDSIHGKGSFDEFVGSNPDIDFRDWSNNLMETMPDQQISEQLNKAGIKGIRYLDQGSRGAGKGTHNYVVFDDKIIKILERR